MRNRGHSAAASKGMGERFREGTLLLIDTNFKQITDENGIYALLLGNNIIVRRVQRRLQGGYLIASDNPAIAPETFDRLRAHDDISAKGDDLLVVGRVTVAIQKV